MATQNYWQANYWASKYWYDTYWATQTESTGYWSDGYWNTGYWTLGYWRDVDLAPSSTNGVITQTLADWSGELTGFSAAPGSGRIGVISTTLADWSGSIAGNAIQVEYFDTGGAYFHSKYWATGYFGTSDYWWAHTRESILDIGLAWQVYTYDAFNAEIAVTLADWSGSITGIASDIGTNKGVITQTLADWSGSIAGTYTPIAPVSGVVSGTLADWTGLVTGTSADPIGQAGPVFGAISTTLADWAGEITGRGTAQPAAVNQMTFTEQTYEFTVTENSYRFDVVEL